MTQIRLIASDLDGTLLLNGAQALQEETCGLIRELGKRNISFMAASGRQFDNLYRLFEPIRDEISYLCQNGSSAWADGQLLFCEQMDPAVGRKIIEDIEAHPEAEVFVNSFDCCFVKKGRDAFYHHVRDVVGARTEQTANLFGHLKECTKISLYEEMGLSDVGFWQEKYGRDVTVVIGGSQWLDMMPKGVNKGTGYAKTLARLGILPQETMVLGDNLNDLEILAMAGAAGTVRSGVREVKERADLICDTVEELMKEILAGKTEIEDWKQ